MRRLVGQLNDQKLCFFAFFVSKRFVFEIFGQSLGCIETIRFEHN